MHHTCIQKIRFLNKFDEAYKIFFSDPLEFDYDSKTKAFGYRFRTYGYGSPVSMMDENSRLLIFKNKKIVEIFDQPMKGECRGKLCGNDDNFKTILITSQKAKQENFSWELKKKIHNRKDKVSATEVKVIL